MTPHVENDFGLSSSDEADLLDLDTESIQKGTKRKSEEHLPRDSKKPWNKLTKSPALTTAVKVLHERFRLPAFRLKQEAVIVRLLKGESSVVVFPTGML